MCRILVTIPPHLLHPVSLPLLPDPLSVFFFAPSTPLRLVFFVLCLNFAVHSHLCCSQISEDCSPKFSTLRSPTLSQTFSDVHFLFCFCFHTESLLLHLRPLFHPPLLSQTLSWLHLLFCVCFSSPAPLQHLAPLEDRLEVLVCIFAPRPSLSLSLYVCFNALNPSAGCLFQLPRCPCST